MTDTIVSEVFEGLDLPELLMDAILEDVSSSGTGYWDVNFRLDVSYDSAKRCSSFSEV